MQVNNDARRLADVIMTECRDYMEKYGSGDIDTYNVYYTAVPGHFDFEYQYIEKVDGKRQVNRFVVKDIPVEASYVRSTKLNEIRANLALLAGVR